MKRITSMILCLVIILKQVSAQDQILKGKITEENGTAIPGVSIIVKGTNTGATTREDGSFELNAKTGSILIFSSTGFEQQEVKILGSSIRIVLVRSTKELSEVVVSAFGIKREKKSLGYSSQEVKGNALTQADASNTLSALSGKVAGLQITNSSGTPGAAAYMRLRGVTSLAGGEPLMVIDGVPMDNTTNGVSLGNVAQSNRAIDLNPNDIESITVLKGPAAASLYGTQGSDGVILITTKKGGKAKNGRRFDITYNYGVSFDQINKLPAHQTSFVQGTGGSYRSPSSHSAASFGPNVDTLLWDGLSNQWDKNGNIVGSSTGLGKTKFVPYDNAKQFFRTGTTQNHNLSISGGNDLATYRFSYSNLTQDGIIPLSTFQRNTVSLTADAKLTDNLNAGAFVNFTSSGGQRVQEGSNTSGVMLGLLRSPNSFDNSFGSSDQSNLSSYQFKDGTQRSYRGAGVLDAPFGWYDNPYWTINKNLFNDDVNRIIGNTFLNFTPFKWLSVLDRIGIDQYNDSRKSNKALNSAGAPNGSVTYDFYTYKQVNNDLIATLSHKLTEKINGSLILGYNLYTQKTQHNNAAGTGLTIPDFYDLGNTSNQTAFTNMNVLRRKAIFAQAKFDYNNYLFLDITARNENTSAFVSDSKLKGQWFLFPSASASFIFTDAFHLKSNMLNSGKLRVSYGSAGRLPSTYSTSTYYASAVVADGWTNGLTYPINGQQGFFAGVLGSSNLKPEVTSTFDIGTELRLINNRVGLNFTYYNSQSKDLLAYVPLPSSTGYGNRYINAAKINNYGFEVQLDASIIKTPVLKWDMTINWSMNRSKVIDLGEGVDQLFLGGFTNGSINAVKGKPFGMIYGIGYVKDDKGNTIIDDGLTGGNKGFPIVNSTSVPLGNPNPQWIGGIQNTFVYKHCSFSFLFDTRQKFDVWDGTRGAMVNFGTAKETEQRGQTKLFEGFAGHLDANGKVISQGTPNKTPVVVDQNWYVNGGSGFTVNEPFVEDASFVKLREVSIGYSFNIPGKFIKAVTMNLIGRNLFLLTKYKGIDPETSLGGGTALGIDYFNNPGIRSWGFNIKINL